MIFALLYHPTVNPLSSDKYETEKATKLIPGMQLFFISIVPPFTPSFQLCAYYPNFPSKLEFRSILTFHESRNYVEQFYLDTGPRRIQLRSACLSSAAQLVVCNMFSEASDKLGNIWPKLSLLPGQDNHSRSSFLVDSFHARELWLVTILRSFNLESPVVPLANAF